MKKLFKPFMSLEAIENVNRVLRSEQIAEGEDVKLFEKELEIKLNKQNILTMNSGTSALELAYELAGIGVGDEVITPVLTCTATNLPLLHRGATIVFADTYYDLNIDIDDVKRKITDKTKAIVFVHFGGNNRGLKELVELCNERGIKLIEDAAQAIGSDYWGVGDFTAVSLQAIKTITTGDGGLLITKSREDYEKAKRLRWFGIDRDAKQRGENPDVTEAGYKYHMNNISAGIGRGNLLHLDGLMRHQKMLASIYSSYGLFAHTWLAGGRTNNYEALKKELNDAGFEMGQHHYRNDRYSVFGGRVCDCPIMDEIEFKYFFVPFHFDIDYKDAHTIGNICKKYI
jgi:dTDP-4-amino-4,6-dideoxygalactose transaminase